MDMNCCYHARPSTSQSCPTCWSPHSIISSGWHLWIEALNICREPIHIVLMLSGETSPDVYNYGGATQVIKYPGTTPAPHAGTGTLSGLPHVQGSTPTSLVSAWTRTGYARQVNIIGSNTIWSSVRWQNSFKLGSCHNFDLKTFCQFALLLLLKKIYWVQIDW